MYTKKGDGGAALTSQYGLHHKSEKDGERFVASVGPQPVHDGDRKRKKSMQKWLVQLELTRRVPSTMSGLLPLFKRGTASSSGNHINAVYPTKDRPKAFASIRR